MQQRPTAEQSASKVGNLLLQATERTTANCNLIIAYLNKLTTCEPSYMVTPIVPEAQAAKSYQFWRVWPVLLQVEKRACETLRSCAKRLGGLAATTLPGASRSFNPALLRAIE